MPMSEDAIRKMRSRLMHFSQDVKDGAVASYLFRKATKEEICEEFGIYKPIFDAWLKDFRMRHPEFKWKTLRRKVYAGEEFQSGRI